MKKRLLAMLLTGTMALMTAACGSEAAGSDTPASGDTASSGTHTVSVILKTLNSDYWNCVAAGVKQAEKDFGCKVDLNGPPSETSYDEQINMIETALSNSSVEAIVIAPLQPDATANVVADAEIPVLAVDSTFNSDKLLSYVGVSNYDAAYALGEYAAKSLEPGSNIVLLAGAQGDLTSKDRMEGYTESLEAAGHHILDLQYTDTAPDKAVAAMEGMMQQYPSEIDAVMCLSDDVAVAAANAVSSAGKTDSITVYGFGGISGAQPVKDKILKATVNINPYEMGYNCVAKALDAIDGKQIDEFYPTEPQIIDESNIDDFMVQLKEWTE